MTKELDWLRIGKCIAARLRRKWPWIEKDELLGCAMLGAVQANDVYEQKFIGSSRLAWVHTKGFYLAVDELRAHHGIVRNDPRYKKRPATMQGSALRGDDGEEILFAEHSCMGVPQEHYVRTSCREWLRGLSDREKRVLVLHFDEDMMLKTIGKLMGINKNAVSWIKKEALTKLRRTRAREFAAGERSRPSLQ